MDYSAKINDGAPVTPAKKLLKMVLWTIWSCVCVVIIVLGILFGVLAWKDYVDAPHGGYTLIVHPDGSTTGYVDPKTGALISGEPPSRIRNFASEVKRIIFNQPEVTQNNSYPALPAAAAPASNPPDNSASEAGPLPPGLIGQYKNGAFRLVISQPVNSAKGTLNVTILKGDVEIISTIGQKENDNLVFYKDQSHDCPLMIDRFTKRLALLTKHGAKNCGDLSLAGLYYAAK